MWTLQASLQATTAHSKNLLIRCLFQRLLATTSSHSEAMASFLSSNCVYSAETESEQCSTQLVDTCAKRMPIADLTASMRRSPNQELFPSLLADLTDTYSRYRLLTPAPVSRHALITLSQPVLTRTAAPCNATMPTQQLISGRSILLLILRNSIHQWLDQILELYASQMTRESYNVPAQANSSLTTSVWSRTLPEHTRILIASTTGLLRQSTGHRGLIRQLLHLLVMAALLHSKLLVQKRLSIPTSNTFAQGLQILQ